MPLDDEMVLGKRKKEFKKVEIIKVPVTNIRPKKDVIDIKTSFDPHHKYTVEELKEKIKNDELKDTLKVKKKFNPEQGKDLEDKIIKSGNLDLLVEDVVNTQNNVRPKKNIVSKNNSNSSDLDLDVKSQKDTKNLQGKTTAKDKADNEEDKKKHEKAKTTKISLGKGKTSIGDEDSEDDLKKNEKSKNTKKPIGKGKTSIGDEDSEDNKKNDKVKTTKKPIGKSINAEDSEKDKKKNDKKPIGKGKTAISVEDSEEDNKKNEKPKKLVKGKTTTDDEEGGDKKSIKKGANNKK